MPEAPVFDLIANRPELHEQLAVETERHIPGSVSYSIKRFAKPANWMAEDTGMLRYHFDAQDPAGSYLELRFCVTGQIYCRQLQNECSRCRAHESSHCGEKRDSLDVLGFVFNASVLSQYVKSRMTLSDLSDKVLSFTYTSSFTKTLPICNKTRVVLEGLLNHNYTDTLENIYVNAQTQMLLLYGLDCMLGEKEIDTVTCKFLANEADRDKILRAREILIQQIGEPITIKELSRKVTMNECYLKKGFKEMFGTTIFDF
ncbi:MAG TPA: AraC family transcriptional regulator, partial [Chitinophagaceae bacterium]|nr:AraC family transcriptional regulator [Chitinophagaceae bacterium]